MDIAKRTPEEWLQFITNERETYNGANKYKYWMQLYRRAADTIPADEFAHNNNSYAKIMVDFAKLQARTSKDDARNIFQAARSNVKHCSLVYVAWAQFELFNNNPKKCKKLLEKGKQFCAVPGYLLDMALENFNNGNHQLIDDETEEHTFTELINKNSSKTEDFSVLFPRTKHRTSDSSLESTSSSVGVYSPEPAHSTLESSEESADDVICRRRHSSSKNQLSREESQHKISGDDENVQNAANTTTKINSGIITDQTKGADLHSVYSNDDVRNQLDLPTCTMPIKSIAENAQATMKPTSDVTPSQPTTRSFNGDEIKFKFPIANHNATRNQSEAVKENGKELNFAIPVCSSTLKKNCSSGSSESSDDIDALLLKKSLLNIGNKTGLMDFATPQNKSKGQVAETRTGNKIIGGSITKEQRPNVRGTRSVFVGLPMRIPKSTKDEIEDKDEKRNGTNDINGEIIQLHDKTKEKDDIDGVFAFPEENSTINIQGTHVNTGQPLNAAKKQETLWSI